MTGVQTCALPISNLSLVDWFLSASGTVKGYTKAIYTGFPSVEICRIISDYVIPSKSLCGLYQVSSDPISKYELIRIIADVYGKKLTIDPFESFILDRSLDSSRFKEITGYKAPSWEEMIKAMHNHFLSEKAYEGKMTQFQI